MSTEYEYCFMDDVDVETNEPIILTDDIKAKDDCVIDQVMEKFPNLFDDYE